MKNEAQVDCKEMYISLLSRLANDEFGISNTPDHERRLPLADIIRLTYKSGLFLMNVVKREYIRNFAGKELTGRNEAFFNRFLL